MVSWITTLWWGGDPDIPDPNSGMSRRDIYIIQKTWVAVNCKSAVYGRELFFRFFRKHPDAQNLFKSFEGLSENNLGESVMFKAHAQIFMSSFNIAVVNLDQPEVVVALMNKLGTRHTTKHHTEQKHFKEFNDVLLDFLKNDMKLGECEMISWHRFVTFTYEIIFTKT